MEIAVIDYKLCNVQSVITAFRSIGVKAELVSRPEELDLTQVYGLVLPGVGAFGDAMANLRSAGWTSAIPEIVQGQQIPLLGICLGMQLLASYSYEHGEHKGLGIIPGVVKKLPTSAPGVKVPHVGWNDTLFVKDSPLCQGLKKSEVFYFVHSYYVEPEDGESILATTDYACNFASALALKNVFATQFHPEKSQRVGIRILKNFFDICKLGK